MKYSILRLFLSRKYLPVAVLFSLILFTGATFILPNLHMPLPPADVGRVPVLGTDVAFPIRGDDVTHVRNPVLQRMEEIILTEHAISVSA